MPDPAGGARFQIHTGEVTNSFRQSFWIGGWLRWICTEEPATPFELSRLAAIGLEPLRGSSHHGFEDLRDGNS